MIINDYQIRRAEAIAAAAAVRTLAPANVIAVLMLAVPVIPELTQTFSVLPIA